jgi:hypothetical protein
MKMRALMLLTGLGYVGMIAALGYCLWVWW